MKEYPFSLPGYENISFALRPGDMLNSVKVFCDGKPMKLSWGKFRTTLPNGEEIVLRLKFTIDIFTPKIQFKGQTIDVIPSRPTSEKVLIYLPLILVTFGGALGGLCGGVGAYLNFLIFRKNLSRELKVFLTVLISFASLVIYVLSAAWVNTKIK